MYRRTDSQVYYFLYDIDQSFITTNSSKLVTRDQKRKSSNPLNYTQFSVESISLVIYAYTMVLMCIIIIILLCITNYDPLFIHCSYYKFKTYNMTDYNRDNVFKYYYVSLSLVYYYIHVIKCIVINNLTLYICLPYFSAPPPQPSDT